MVRDATHNRIQSWAGTLGRCDDVQIVKEGQQTVGGVQTLGRALQGVVLAQCVECGGKGVPLFAPLPLAHLAAVAVGVPPKVDRRLAVEQPHERK